MSKTNLLFTSVFLVVASGLLIGAPAHADNQSVTLLNSAPYAEDSDIRKKITSECTTLGSKLATFTQKFAKKKGVSVQLTESAPTDSAGQVLQLEITDAVSSGNAFIGHRKFVAIQGTLWENGEKVASFDGQRGSGGGVMAGYKSSCAVLGRCVKALGKDVATWLANPVDEAELGD